MLIHATAAFLALPGVFAFLLPVTVALCNGCRARWSIPAALTLGLGLALLLRCVCEFYRTGRGTLAPWDPPRQLVTTGPYRYSRNPMYLAVMLIQIGWWLLYGHTPLLVYALALAIAFHLRVLLVEEPWAAQRFGDRWSDHRQRVRRWT